MKRPTQQREERTPVRTARNPVEWASAHAGEQFPEPSFYKVPIDRKILRTYQARTNRHGLTYFGTYVGLLIVFGGLTVWVPSFPLKVLFFVLYATVFAFSEPILHETHHRTPFRSLAVNEVVHYIAGLLVFNEPIRARWLHAAHHTYTSYSDRDPEFQTERPPNFYTIGLDFFRLRYAPLWLMTTVRLALFGPDTLAKAWVPASDHRKLVWSARSFIVFYAGVIGLAVAISSWYPILFIFAARFVGPPFFALLSLPQHAGLEEDVEDWRLNTRTIHMGPIAQFLYWNMNYHLEHHMFPTLPYHALPSFHREIEGQTPPAYRSTMEAWREMLPALWRQRKEPLYSARRPLPSDDDPAAAGGAQYTQTADDVSRRATGALARPPR
jgi:fatty acid desaturase